MWLGPLPIGRGLGGGVVSGTASFFFFFVATLRALIPAFLPKGVEYHDMGNTFLS